MAADVELLPLPEEEWNVRYGYCADTVTDYARANVAHATAAQAAEIARLTEALEFQSALTKNLLPYQDEAVAGRAEIEALRAEVTHERWLREQAENVTEAERYARDAYKARAERLAEALREILDWMPDCGPWGTGTPVEARKRAEALLTTAAQEDA